MRKRTCRVLSFFLGLSLLFSLFSCSADRYEVARICAMGTLCTLTLERGKTGIDGNAASTLPAYLNDAEETLSHRFESSVIARLNREGSVTADARLLSALKLCQDIKEKTDGRFSLSVLPLTSLWDFDAASPVPPTSEALFAALDACRGSALSFEGDTALRMGGTLDLGAIGKGYACDVLADALCKRGETGLVAIGGSIAAVGTKAGNPWRIGVRDPFGKSGSEMLGELLLSDSFVSTSGSYEKTFTYEGKTYHHILDPETGLPAESDLVSVTVLCENGTLSDALSTACFLVGADAAFSLAAEYGASLVAVKTDGTLLVSKALRESFTPAHGWEAVYR